MPQDSSTILVGEPGAVSPQQAHRDKSIAVAL